MNNNPRMKLTCHRKSIFFNFFLLVLEEEILMQFPASMLAMSYLKINLIDGIVDLLLLISHHLQNRIMQTFHTICFSIKIY